MLPEYLANYHSSEEFAILYICIRKLSLIDWSFTYLIKYLCQRQIATLIHKLNILIVTDICLNFKSSNLQIGEDFLTLFKW